MLTIEKECEIRRLINEIGLTSDRQIGEATGVSRTSVKRVRKTMQAIRDMGITKALKVRKLLLNGLSRFSISAEAQVSPEQVSEVKLFYFQQRRDPGGDDKLCPTCGSIMFSENYKFANRSRGEIKLPPAPISEEKALALFRVVIDLCELDRLCIIPNPLFHYLALRAQTALGVKPEFQHEDEAEDQGKT